MAHRQTQARRRTQSSCSNSSSASASPSNSSSLNFTLYGAPAPRSAHRTSSGAVKARPRRRSTKPTPPPPTSPLSTSRPENDDPLDLKLDLSPLAGDGDTLLNNEVYYSQNGPVNPSLNADERNESKGNVPENNIVELNETQIIQIKDNGLSIANNSARSFCSDKDFLSQTCSELDESSQGFGDIFHGSESYRSNSSSYFTLSEYSVNYSASVSSDDSKLDSDADTIYKNRNSIYRTHKGESMKNVENSQRIEFLEESIDTQTKCMNNEVSRQNNENENFHNQSKQHNFQTKIYATQDENFPCNHLNSLFQDDENMASESSRNNNLFDKGSIADTVLATSPRSELSFKHVDRDRELSYDPCQNHDNQTRNSPEVYGYYVLHKGHETPTEKCSFKNESLTTGKSYSDQENSLEKCTSLFLDDLGTCSNGTVNYSVSSDSNNFFGSDEHNEHSDGVVIDLHSICVGNESLKTQSNSKANRNPIDAKTPEQLVPKSSVSQHESRISSTAKCNCNSELLQHLESGYFSDIPVPDIRMTAEDIMEAVLYARQLVRVLERALDRALCSKESSSDCDTPRSDSDSRSNKRCRSLSPNLLRRCKSVVPLSSNEFNLQRTDNESDLGRTKYQYGIKDYYLDVPEANMKMPLTYDRARNFNTSKKRKPRVTPEELQKQRALLKPPAEKNLRETVTHVLDMADILKSVISRRRKVMEPSESFNYGTNISDWSLESSPRQYDA